ncbi:glycosyltransferase 87 family protein [Angustibacter sp. McL0619]|uniref:glycosyltransferase 87 family protein n=1 Tax=Angustibacter sp. McL0619 TaxID=3415676 RepID=UPI003CF055DC
MRYRFAIVLVLTSAAVLLVTALLRRWRLTSMPLPVLAGTVLVSGLVAEAVPFFSHADAGDRRLLAHVVAATCLLAAAMLLVPGPRGRTLSAGVATVGVVAWTATAIALVPAPRIDVWVTLQQAADGLANGRNMYTMTWHGSPGIQDAFTYLPWTAVLLAPGRWLFGDVRWALLAAMLVGLGCLVALGRRRDRTGRTSSLALAAATMLALAPGSVTQAEQAWTEPLLFALIAAWALLVHRGHAWWAVLPLALGCASKQHLVLLLPVLACWSLFGWRRSLATAAAAGGLVLPWFLASPQDFWHDTVSLLVSFHPIKFANTWFIAAQTELGRTPPFWLTGLVVLGVLALACVVVRRRQPDLGELLGWVALVLLVANLVNKQAFYNQFWLVGSLVALAIAASPAAESPAAESPPAQASSRET